MMVMVLAGGVGSVVSGLLFSAVVITAKRAVFSW